jgi:hypothetical protein
MVRAKFRVPRHNLGSLRPQAAKYALIDQCGTIWFGATGATQLCATTISECTQWAWLLVLCLTYKVPTVRFQSIMGAGFA